MAARFARVLEAEPASTSLVRRSFQAWLDGLGWPPTEAADLVLAVDEAVANVVDHAYLHADPDRYRQVRVLAEELTGERERRIRIQIADSGRWRPARPDPGYRGRGLSMMRACGESLHIDTTPAGTRVTLTSRTVSPRQRAAARRDGIPLRSKTSAS